jgi:linearmycin/streptolysin S transport system permease protein
VHGVLAIASKDLRQRLRDRSAIVLVLVAPLLIASLMSFAFRSLENFHYTLGFVDADRGPIGASLAGALGQPALRKIVTVRVVTSAQAAEREVRSGSLQAALVVPAGFSQSVQGGAPLSLEAMTSVNSPVAGTTTTAIASSFVAQINADRLSVETALAAGAPPSSLARLERAVRSLKEPERVASMPVGARQLTPISYYAPAMAIFFMLFAVTFTARSFFVDKATGMVDRMRVAPLRSWQIVIGKAASAFAFCLVSLTIIAVTTSLAFGASWGGPVPAAALVLVMAAATACLSALVIVISRTQRQAEAIGSIVVFSLALLGGNFVMQSSMSPLMRRLAFLTPNGWVLRGFTDLGTVGGGLGQVAGPILAVSIFCVVTGGLAIALAPRALAR